jgi:hypothetical protein
MEHKETLENRHYMVAKVGYDPVDLCSDCHVALNKSCPGGFFIDDLVVP